MVSVTPGAAEALWYHRPIAAPVLQVVVWEARLVPEGQPLTLSDGAHYFKARLAPAPNVGICFPLYPLELGCLIRLTKFHDPPPAPDGGRELRIDAYEVVSRPRDGLVGSPQPVEVLPPAAPAAPGPAALSAEVETLFAQLRGLKGDAGLSRALAALHAQLLTERQQHEATRRRAQDLLMSAVDVGDVTVRACDGRGLRTRRAVLARAEVLGRMLDSGMMESQSDEVRLEDVDALSLRYLVAALHAGPDFPAPLPSEPERLGVLVELAAFYGVPWLGAQAADALAARPWGLEALLSPFAFLGLAEQHLASDAAGQRGVWEGARRAAVAAIVGRLEEALLLPDFAALSLSQLDSVARALAGDGAAAPWLSSRGRTGPPGALAFDDSPAFEGALDGDALSVRVRHMPPSPAVEGCAIFAARLEVRCEGQERVVCARDGAVCGPALTVRPGLSRWQRTSRLGPPAPEDYVLKVRLLPLERQCRAVVAWAKGNLPDAAPDLVGVVVGLAELGPEAAALQGLVCDYIARAMGHLPDPDRLRPLPPPLLRRVLEQGALHWGGGCMASGAGADPMERTGGAPPPPPHDTRGGC